MSAKLRSVAYDRAPFSCDSDDDDGVAAEAICKSGNVESLAYGMVVLFNADREHKSRSHCCCLCLLESAGRAAPSPWATLSAT